MRTDSPFRYQSGDNRFSGWARWASRRGYPFWVVPVGFVVLTAALFGVTMLCLFLFLPKPNTSALVQQVEQIPGVKSATLNQNADRYQTLGETLTVHLQTGAVVTDPKALVRYLYEIEWAADGSEPVQAVIQVEGGADVNVFLAAVEDGWNTAGGQGRLAQVDGTDLKAVLGPYPGEVPTAPAGMITYSKS